MEEKIIIFYLKVSPIVTASRSLLKVRRVVLKSMFTIESSQLKNCCEQ